MMAWPKAFPSSSFKIDRNDLFRGLAHLSGHGLMVGMNSIGLKGLTGLKFCNQCRVERAFKMQNIGPNIQTRKARYELRESPEPTAMLLADRLRHIRPVPPANYMDQHASILLFGPMKSSHIM